MSATMPGLDELAERLGHRFERPELLRRALAHRSWVAETPGETSNERLEFLGDAVLGWVVADLAFHRFEQQHEGVLTDVRKAVVNADALAAVARELGLGAHLLLGKGEDAAGGRDKPSILSDAFEAVLGAVYLDGGTEAAHEVVRRLIGPRLDAATDFASLDHKSALQEATAERGLGPPVYQVDSTGPDHAKRFVAVVLVDGALLGEGRGRSKKGAERDAAAHALRSLGAR